MVEDKVNKLLSIGISLNSFEDKWNKNYDLAKEYIKNNTTVILQKLVYKNVE